MSGMKGYLLSVSSASILVGLSSVLLPGSMRNKSINFVAAMLLLFAVVAPILKIDAGSVAKSIAMMQMDAEQMRTGVEVKNREILSELIKERCETYILDKAERMSVNVQAEITMSEEGEYPYPVFVQISGTLSVEDRTYLQKLIEQDLGIPPEQQEWR